VASTDVEEPASGPGSGNLMRAEPRPNPEASLTRAAGGVSLAVLASRILGLVREVVFTSLFGASRELDAFIAAFRIPN
jgi:putative peptidoglycan lipid II flippase